MMGDQTLLQLTNIIPKGLCYSGTQKMNTLVVCAVTEVYIVA